MEKGINSPIAISVHVNYWSELPISQPFLHGMTLKETLPSLLSKYFSIFLSIV